MERKIAFAKCSNILKDPYKTRNAAGIFYPLYNYVRTFINLTNFENFFVDFNHNTFPKQAKQIFDEVSYYLKENTIPPSIAKNLNENIFGDLGKNELKAWTEVFTKKTYDWRIVHARTLYLTEPMEELANNYAQITLCYNTEENRDMASYIVFERELNHNFSMYHWKIFIPKYDYFGKDNYL